MLMSIGYTCGMSIEYTWGVCIEYTWGMSIEYTHGMSIEYSIGMSIQYKCIDSGKAARYFAGQSVHACRQLPQRSAGGAGARHRAVKGCRSGAALNVE